MMGSTGSRRPEVACQAIIRATSPSDVVIVPRPTPISPEPVSATRARVDDVAIARVNRPELTTWLCDAINRRLEGVAPARPRPRGLLLERGAFDQIDSDVVARDWYGRGRQIHVARCGDPDAARELAEQLNGLLQAS